MESNRIQQIEELEALSSIYGSEWCKENNDDYSYSIKINKNVELFITFIPDYPSNKPPTYQLLAPLLTREKKEEISQTFETIYKQNYGGPIVFQLIEGLKELTDIHEDTVSTQVENLEGIECPKIEKPQEISYPIVHGTVIQDRKSNFQGHACAIQNQNDVKNIMDVLLQNKKIAQATHNILAYRINTPSGSVLQDCDDDGETHAGSRLLHLLQIINVTNIVVVVTRWYGGTNLGPDRFRHINNAARQVLQQGGFL